MATVLVSPRARRNLDRLVETHTLPAATIEPFVASIEPLGVFPLLGAQLGGRWAGCRFVLGPWRWMVIVYEFRQHEDVVGIVTVQDARTRTAPTVTR